MSSTKSLAGLFLIGMAVGLYLPGFPAPLTFVNQWLGIAFIIAGIILLIKA